MKQIKMGPSTLSIPAMALGIMRMDQKKRNRSGGCN